MHYIQSFKVNTDSNTTGVTEKHLNYYTKCTNLITQASYRTT